MTFYRKQAAEARAEFRRGLMWSGLAIGMGIFGRWTGNYGTVVYSFFLILGGVCFGASFYWLRLARFWDRRNE